MKNINILIAFFFLMFSGSAALSAGYPCPASNDSSGGWTPPECSVEQPASMSSGYACPPGNSTAGGWLPPQCKVCRQCGTVEAVNAVEVGDATGLGAVAGAVAGGVLGNQVGKGKGRTLATVIGAVGGGVAGHYGEKYIKKGHWEVIVKMDDGSRQTVKLGAETDLQPGDKVRVEGDAISRQ